MKAEISDKVRNINDCHYVECPDCGSTLVVWYKKLTGYVVSIVKRKK